MTPEKAIRQLRLEILNARECEDDTAEVSLDVLDAAVAEIDRLTREATQLRETLHKAEAELDA